MGISLFAGEAEEAGSTTVLRDAAAGTLKPLYNYMDDLPGIEGDADAVSCRGRACRAHRRPHDQLRCRPRLPVPVLVLHHHQRAGPQVAPPLAGRRRARSFARTGRRASRRFFITDDNFARNKDWEAIFDRLIAAARAARASTSASSSRSTRCATRSRTSSRRRARAGVTRVFIGLENINPDNLLAAKKRQNKITEYRKMLLAWKRAGVITYAGYILGFPDDTRESIQRDIEIIKKELPLDILEFFFLTPLPGSEDHKVLWHKQASDGPGPEQVRPRACGRRPRQDEPRGMGEGLPVGLVELLFARAQADDHPPGARLRCRHVAAGSVLFAFSIAFPIEGLHPLQFGMFRLKYRTDRRPGLPIEPALAVLSALRLGNPVQARPHDPRVDRSQPHAQAARAEQKERPYTDLALTAVTENETETLEMFTQSDAARNSVAHVRKIDELTHGKRALADAPAA